MPAYAGYVALRQPRSTTSKLATTMTSPTCRRSATGAIGTRALEKVPLRLAWSSGRSINDRLKHTRDSCRMPGKGTSQRYPHGKAVKRPKAYDALVRSGVPKGKAAAISNAMARKNKQRKKR
jgi:hypothetical protein